jgi:antitoxin CptB
VTEAERRKRFQMRCWRRGMKEMDLILGPFADAVAAGREAVNMDAFEDLIEENDQDLFAWISGAAPTPAEFVHRIDRLRAFLDPTGKISH